MIQRIRHFVKLILCHTIFFLVDYYHRHYDRSAYLSASKEEDSVGSRFSISLDVCESFCVAVFFFSFFIFCLSYRPHSISQSSHHANSKWITPSSCCARIASSQFVCLCDYISDTRSVVSADFNEITIEP